MTGFGVRIRMLQIKRGRKLSVENMLKLTDKVCEYYERLKLNGIKEFQYMERLEHDVAHLYDALDPFIQDGEIGTYRSVCLRLVQMARRAIESPYVPLLLMILYRCAGAELMAGYALEAHDLYKEVGERIREMIGEDNAYMIRCLDRQAEALLALGEYEGAEKLYEEAYERAVLKWGEFHPMAEIEGRHLINAREWMR